MSSITFDTLKFVETLKAAGVSDEQAKAISNAVRDAHEMAELATKRDLAELRTELQRDIRELEYRMTIKLGGLMVAAVGIVATLVKLL